jgi:phytoene dehydrogenase-like protein
MIGKVYITLNMVLLLVFLISFYKVHILDLKTTKRRVFNYVGASTIPGSGIPMVLISSKLVIERILKDYGNAP